ncbi:MAG: MFS transporter [Spirochaetota bacterium]
MTPLFTREEIESGRRTFHRFMGFNVLAFSILTGNVISVFALKLGVSNAYIGLLQSFMHLSMVFILAGRLLMQSMRSVTVFAFGWFARYFFAALLLAIPLVVGRPDGTAIATVIVLVAAAGFHIFRGIGVAGQVAIVAGLASGADRGRFLSVNSILSNGIALAGGLAIASLLGADAPVGRFTAAFSFAIFFGLLSVVQIRRLPEPNVTERADFASFLADVRSVVHDEPVKRFLVYLCSFAFGSSILIAFLVVLSKRVYGLPDNFTVLLVAIGNLGAIVAGVLNRRLIDTSGGRPLIVFFVATMLVVSLAMAGAAGTTRAQGVVMAAGFFLAMAAMNGLLVSSQSYYFGLYGEQKHRNLGLLFSLVMGSFGAVGSYAGGVVLDALEARMELALAFRWLFIAIAAIGVLTLVLSLRLVPNRARPRRRVREFISLRARRFWNRLSARVRRR